MIDPSIAFGERDPSSLLQQTAAAMQQQQRKTTLPAAMPAIAPTLKPSSEDSLAAPSLGSVPPPGLFTITTFKADTSVTLALIEFSARTVIKLL
mmetsp:Transcript_11909/g.23110  ORF Transcript_11909/g.23110 Transcript_11909/m.23110 type:complete len:94 (-) Transcript_11909:550-831(-)